MKKEKPSFSNRGFTSLLLAFSFVGLALSGVVMYVAPPCSVASVINWKLLMITKDQWASIHQVSALTMLVLAVFHLFVFNWRPFKCYWRRRKSRSQRIGQQIPGKGLFSRIVMPVELFAALVAAIILYAGAVSLMAPFGWLHDGSEAIKEQYREEVDTGSGRGLGYGQIEGRSPAAPLYMDEYESGIMEQESVEVVDDPGTGQGQGTGEGRGSGQGQGTGEGRGAGDRREY